MYKKYNKTIIKQHYTHYNNNDYEVLVLDDTTTYNIHILNIKYQDNEMNTIYQQIPKDDITREAITDALFLECLGLQYALWDKFYGHNKQMHSFNIECVESYNLDAMGVC